MSCYACLREGEKTWWGSAAHHMEVTQSKRWCLAGHWQQVW